MYSIKDKKWLLKRYCDCLTVYSPIHFFKVLNKVHNSLVHDLFIYWRWILFSSSFIFFFIKITLKTGWTIVIIIKRIEESEKFKFNSIKWLGIWENNRAYLWSDRCIYYEYNRLPWILKMTDHCVLQSSGSRDLITLKIFRSLLIISFLFLYRVINMDGSYSWLLILWLFLHMKKTWGPVFISKFTIKGLD